MTKLHSIHLDGAMDSGQHTNKSNWMKGTHFISIGGTDPMTVRQSDDKSTIELITRHDDYILNKSSSNNMYTLYSGIINGTEVYVVVKKLVCKVIYWH
jgi:hypothetical protein